MLSLDPGDIHLWLAQPDEIDDAQLHRAYRELCNEQEQQQESRFHFARDRQRYLVTRALVRTVLSRYEPVAPEAWTFTNNPYGRPQIANTGLGDAGLTFNVSHTRGLIVLGVTRQRALGVDVENVLEREVSIEIADRFFAPAEVTALAAVAPDRQKDRFFEYWTFKESYIKARGMGLSLPLDKFSFHYPHANAVRIVIDDELADDPARWQFWQFRPSSQHLVAVCAERIQGQDASVVIRRVIPMVDATQVPVTFLRTCD